MHDASVHGEPSIRIASDRAEAWMTLRGNHIAPVVFRGSGRSVQPYSVAPWLPKEVEGDDPLLGILRGDFLCLPFGAQPDGPAHGMTASAAWTVTARDDTQAVLSLHADDTGADVVKTVSVRPGHAAIYQHVRLTGLDGDYSYGTHPVLDLSGHGEAGARISTSPMRWSSVFPGVFSDPASGETQVLAPGARFDELSAVPRSDGGLLDLSRYPTTRGHEDLVMMVNDPLAGKLAWSAVSAGGTVWFALKDVRDFPATLLWVSNGGRTRAPWSGRHVGRLGIEEVCSYFHEGLSASREDRLAGEGIATARRFRPDVAVDLRVLHAVAFADGDFGRVASIVPAGAEAVRLTDESGRTADAAVDWQFVLS